MQRRNTRVKGHAIKWSIYEAGIRRPWASTMTMSDQKRWDARCQCGWDSATLGSSYTNVKALVDAHKAGAEPVTIKFEDTISAWVEPSGKAHFVTYAGHYTWARDHGFTDFKLEDQGWIHLSGGNLYGRGAEAPTQKQMDTLFDLRMSCEGKALSATAKGYFDRFANSVNSLFRESGS